MSKPVLICSQTCNVMIHVAMVNTKEFGGTSKFRSQLSRGFGPCVPRTFCPICVDLHRNQVGTSWISLRLPLDRPQDTSEVYRPPKSFVCFIHRFFFSRIRDRKGTPKRTFATKILPNFRLNFLVRFASKPLCYRVVPSNYSENSLALFVLYFFWALGFFFWPLIEPKCLL